MTILVLCTGNSCRSQMAEGFFRKYFLELDDKASAHAVRSAGVEPHGVNPRAIQVMAEVGIDISGHTSKHLSQYLNQRFDFVITVCNNAAANCPNFPGATALMHWPFDDPASATGTEEEILNKFRRVRDEIGAKVHSWLGRLFSP